MPTMAYSDRVSRGSQTAKPTDVNGGLSLSNVLREDPTQVLCDTGDIVLVVDDGFHPILKVRVSTVVLSMASKVFRVMFSSGFAEAKAIRNSPDAPVEVRVNDPPSDALLLCQLLHFQGSLDELDSEGFLGLAVIIDKYDCAESLRHATCNKFAALRPNEADQIEHLCYATAAWILDQPKFFRQLTKDMVLYYGDGPTKDEESRLDVLPSEVLASIRSQRRFAGQELIYHLSKFIAKYQTAAYLLDRPVYSHELIQDMLFCDLWPLDLRRSDIDLSYLFRQLREFHVPIMQADRLEHSKPGARSTGRSTIARKVKLYSLGSARGPAPKIVEPPLKFELNNIVERIELYCVGLCLDCFKGNNSCRVPHPDPFNKDLLVPLRYMDQDGRPDLGLDAERLAGWEDVW